MNMKINYKNISSTNMNLKLRMEYNKGKINLIMII